jgi:hypothetical protein
MVMEFMFPCLEFMVPGRIYDKWIEYLPAFGASQIML